VHQEFAMAFEGPKQRRASITKHALTHTHTHTQDTALHELIVEHVYKPAAPLNRHPSRLLRLLRLLHLRRRRQASPQGPCHARHGDLDKVRGRTLDDAVNRLRVDLVHEPLPPKQRAHLA